LAERIIARRDERGGFGSLDELLEVSGITERVLINLRPRLRIE
jgi:DNA uptake protein ComE-like DNA-binding protein